MEKENPLISILIPVYNVGAYLEKCLDSCLSQTYEPVEIIVINDGSRDDSGEICDRYAKRDSRIRVFHQVNSGVVKARKRAIQEAGGEFLFFVDGDDYIDEQAIWLLYKQIEEGVAEIAVGEIAYDRGGRLSVLKQKLSYGNNREGFAKSLLMGELPFSLCCKLIPKALMEKVEVPDDLRIGEDALSVTQLADRIDRIGEVRQPLYFYVYRPASAMNRPGREAIESQLRYVRSVRDFYLSKSYYQDEAFQECLTRFMLIQYYFYLKIGGDTRFDPQMTREINRHYLNNRRVVRQLPVWIVIMLKSYRLSPAVGRCWRTVFTFLRNRI